MLSLSECGIRVDEERARKQFGLGLDALSGIYLVVSYLEEMRRVDSSPGREKPIFLTQSEYKKL